MEYFGASVEQSIGEREIKASGFGDKLIAMDMWSIRKEF
jgi:hypothetical protein